MKKTLQFILNTVGPLATLVLAIVVFKALVAGREMPDRERPPDRGMLVEVSVAEQVREPVVVHADGSVVPARQVVVQPQVAGRLDSVHPALVVGGLVSEGDRLVSIEDDDYGIAVDEARAAVAQAETQLEIELGRQRVAAREWEIFRGEAPDSADSTLATREPQVRAAEIQVEMARARLAQARLNRGRTTVDAPFNGIVLRENVELGQLVTIQSQLATIAGTDEFWIQAAVPIASIDSIELPGVNAVEGSAVRVVQRGAGGEIEREGRVVRLLGELSQVGHMAQVVISVEDPLDLQRPVGDRRSPLLLGSYVSVEIAGARIEDVVEVPRTALHDGSRIYVAVDGELQVREVEIAWRTEDAVYVRSGVEAGDRYITSPVPIAVDGMKVRVAGDEPAQGESDA